MPTRSISALFAISLTVLGCSQSTPGGAPIGPGDGKIVFTGDQTADWAQIVALEDQAHPERRESVMTQCLRELVGRGAQGEDEPLARIHRVVPHALRADPPARLAGRLPIRIARSSGSGVAARK